MNCEIPSHDIYVEQHEYFVSRHAKCTAIFYFIHVRTPYIALKFKFQKLCVSLNDKFNQISAHYS